MDLTCHEAEQIVREDLDEFGPCRATGIIARVPLREHRVYDALSRLIRRGVVTATGKRPRVYDIAPVSAAAAPPPRPPAPPLPAPPATVVLPDVSVSTWAECCCPTCRGSGRVRVTYEPA